jgi:heme exporter protein A
MLDVQGLAARRGDAALFAGIEFALEPGEALFVRGPNGSGKTTLLRILAGVTQAAAGQVRWGNQAVGPFAPALRTNALFIGHAPALKDELTTEENLASLTSLHGAGAGCSAVIEALGAWSLTRQRALPARVLSQGQRRRTSLARLQLVSRPLWLLDEPGTALDDAGAATLASALAAHLTAGGIAVIATHQDLPLAGGVSRWLHLE